MSITIIPAIIPHSYRDITEKVAFVKSAAKLVQIDLIDGVYAHGSPASWPYNGRDSEDFKRLYLQESGLPFWEECEFECDLMVRYPEEKIEDWINAGASTLIIHIESTDTLKEIFERARSRVAIALAIKPSTDIALLEPWVEHAVFIQVMGSDVIGRHGIPLDERVVGKIGDIKKRYSHAILGVDIGVTAETIGALARAGAERFAVGSAIFDRHSAKEAIADLFEAVTT